MEFQFGSIKGIFARHTLRVVAVIAAVLLVSLTFAFFEIRQNADETKLTDEQVHAVAVFQYQQFLMHHVGEDQIKDVLNFFDIEIQPLCEWSESPQPTFNGSGGYTNYYIRCRFDGKFWGTVAPFFSQQDYDDGLGLSNSDTLLLIEFLLKEGFINVDVDDNSVHHFSGQLEKVSSSFVRCYQDCIVLQQRFQNCFKQSLWMEYATSYLFYAPEPIYVGTEITERCQDRFLITAHYQFGEGNWYDDSVKKQ